jgi:hypothetical protein
MNPNQYITCALNCATDRFVIPILPSILPMAPSSSLIIPQLQAFAPTFYSFFIMTFGSSPLLLFNNYHPLHQRFIHLLCLLASSRLLLLLLV